MACIPVITGFPVSAKLLPGQTITYTITVTVPNTVGCNCGNAIQTITAALSNAVDFTISPLTTPVLPLAGFCGVGFNITFDLTAGVDALGQNTVITFTMNQTGGNSITFNLRARGVGITVPNYINAGDVCIGAVVPVTICNDSDATTTVYLDGCSCPSWIWGDASLTIEACSCAETSITLDTDVLGSQQCVLQVTDDSASFYDLNIIWNQVLCPIGVNTWDIQDKGNIVPWSSSAHSADCDIDTIGVIGEYKEVTIALSTLVTPVQIGDVIYFSQWQFAQLPDWAFQYVPSAGWSWQVCADAMGSIDGSFNMEWYGQAPSVENSADTPFMGITIANSGLDISFKLRTHLAADALYEPAGTGYSPHDMFLKNALNNVNELELSTQNSVYYNVKWWSFAMVIERKQLDTFQQTFLSIRSRFQFYDETQPLGAAGSNVTYDITSGEAQAYLSTVRTTNMRIEFDWSAHPTPPDGALLQIIRCDTDNWQENLYTNYNGVPVADVLAGTPDGIISAVTTPVTYTGTGTRYYTEVQISAIPGYVPGEFVPNTYRLQLYLYDIASTSVWGNCSRLIETIDYDDTRITFGQLDVNFADNGAIYAPSINHINQLPVHHAMEIGFFWDSALDDLQVQQKTGNVIQTAQECVELIELRMYKRDAMTGTNLLLNTQYYNPKIQQICGGQVNTAAQNNEPAFTDRSSGAVYDLAFPISLPDNTLQQVTRANLFQSSAAEPNKWTTYSNGSIDCAAESAGCDGYIITKYPNTDLTGALNLNGITYMEAINEIWVCDSANDVIIRIDPISRISIGTIALTAGDAPVAIGYMLGQSKCYVSCAGSSVVRIIDIYAYSVTGTVSGYTGGQPQRMARYTAVGVDIMFIANALSNNVSVVDIATDTETTTIGVGVLPLDCILANGFIFVGSYNSSTVEKIDPATLTLLSSVTVSGQPFRLCYCPTTNAVWIGINGGVDVMDVATMAFINLPFGTQVGGIAYNSLDGRMYVILDAFTDLLAAVDPITYSVMTTYSTGSYPRDIIILNANAQIYVTNYLSQDLAVWGLNPCQDAQLPTFSWAAQTIELEWRLHMKFFGNTETYITPQRISQIIPPLEEGTSGGTGTGVVVTIDTITVDGTWLPGNPCIEDKKSFRVNATFSQPTTVYSVGLEIQPTRGTFYTDATTAPVAAPFIDPVVSPYISGLTPAFGPTTTLQFIVDYPAMPAGNDVSMNLIFIFT